MNKEISEKIEYERNKIREESIKLRKEAKENHTCPNCGNPVSGKIISHELAFEHHPIAEKIKRMRIDGPEGKPRIIVDQSKGFPELETVDKETAGEDMEKLRANTKILATTDLQETFNILTSQVSIVTELAKHANTAQDQMDQVIASLGKITQAIGAIIGIGGK